MKARQVKDSLESVGSELGTAPPEPAATGAGLTEERIRGAVRGLLAGRDIGRADNFFLVGGHSLLAAQLLVQLRESLGVNLTLRQLFSAPTIADLAALVDRNCA